MMGRQRSPGNGAGAETNGGTVDLVLPSRRKALDLLQAEAALELPGPLLVTGEPGTGKSWLWRRFVQELPSQWRWLSVTMTQAADVLELRECIAQGLGIAATYRTNPTRLALTRTLEEERSEGRLWALVIENSQSASEQVWSELESYLGAMEESSGFGLIVLVGPGELTQQLKSRARRTIATRIAAHVHLMPLDLQETKMLAEGAWGPDRHTVDSLEALHRDAAGNPRRLQQLWRKIATADRALCHEAPRVESGTARVVPAPVAKAVGPAPMPIVERVEERQRLLVAPAQAPLVPSRPPLRIEEGLIEVGWEGNLEAEPLAGESEDDEVLKPERPRSTGADAPAASTPEPMPVEESIEDHYAALQAWTEWARNHGQAILAEGNVEVKEPAEASSPDAADALEAVGTSSRQGTSLRAEPQHEHSPYSQLFTRLRQSR